MGKIQKTRYRGYSYNTFYYCYARHIEEAKRLIRQQALKAVGKYKFTSLEYEESPGSNKYLKTLLEWE